MPPDDPLRDLGRGAPPPQPLASAPYAPVRLALVGSDGREYIGERLGPPGSLNFRIRPDGTTYGWRMARPGEVLGWRAVLLT